MRVIKCDICKKEINPEIAERGYIRGRVIDLCSGCLQKFNEFSSDLCKQEDQLQKEYEEKRKKIYESTITKYGLNKE